MQIKDCLQNVEFERIIHNKNIEIKNLTMSSKEKLPGSIFFCINGQNFDGHDFADEAVKNGAVCLVVERLLEIDIMQVQVDSVRKAMARICVNFYKSAAKVKMIAITGTNGKTSTAFLVKFLLTKLNKKAGLIGTEGVLYDDIKLPPILTTPDPIDLHKTIQIMSDKNIEYVVMEASAHALALDKLHGIVFETGAITNITQDHLDFFATMENYKSAKEKLFLQCKTGIFNIDDLLCRNIFYKCKTKKIGISLNNFTDFYAEKFITDVNGISAEIWFKNKLYKLKSNLAGMHNLYNLLTAISIVCSLGFSIAKILKILEKEIIVIPGRYNVLNIPADFKVVVDYAHTPDGVKNILNATRPIAKGRIITVFGCGGNRDKLKRPIMGAIASEHSDFIIITSDNPRDEDPKEIIRQIKKGINANNYIEVVNRKTAIETALKMAQKNDIVLLLGKGSETTQEIAKTKIVFSDYQVVYDYFKIP